MLVDDDEDDNFFHEMAIIDNDLANTVIVQNSAKKALSYLKEKTDPLSDLIFLDINMPGMTGWEFLEEYNHLNKELQGKAVIIMLSTSANSKDITKAKNWDFVSDYITKPLTKEAMEIIIEKYF
ncbi:MAG: hypothetical protein JWP12_2528 [Bacteroidetes bacterium]|nr:hypothetical protein [Bacteroidota bacterium]